MPPWEMVGPSAQDASARPSGTSRLVNCYREPAERSIILRPMPGVVPFSTLSGTLLRALVPIEDDLIAAHGGTLYRISEAGEATAIATIFDNAETTVAGLLGDIVAVAGGRYFLRTEEGVTSEPTVGAFSDFGSCVVTAQRVLLTERNGRRVQWSDVAAPETLNGLSFATTEQRDDLNIRAALVGGEPWIFKQTCIERWYASGSGFAAIPGGLIDVGLKAFRLLTPIRGGVFFVGSDNRAYRASPGGSIEPLSSRVVDDHIVNNDPKRAFEVRWQGRSFYAITFSDTPAWLCDSQTGEWFERGEGQELGPWRAVAAAEAWGRSFVGFDDGSLLEHEAGADDNGDPLVRKVVTSTVRMAGRRFRVTRLEVPAQVGVGTLDTDGPFTDPWPTLTATPNAPHVLLRVSGDDGKTWGPAIPRSLGAAGDYGRRVVWRALGQFAAFTAEFTCSEPLDISLDATAYLEVA